MPEFTKDLHVPGQFFEACNESSRHGGGPLKPAVIQVDGLYCPKCGERRRVDFTVIPHTPPFGAMPFLASMMCRQCHSVAFGLGYQGPSGSDLVVVRSVMGGTSTPNTPAPVKFYLDQAARAESIGARSAAVAMYRAAIEQLLFEQGFQTGMLHRKITDLEAAIAAGTAPKWSVDLGTDFLTVLKELGNGAIHPNGGDIQKQAALDDRLIVMVRATVEELLYVVYEEPIKRAARLAALKAAAAVVT